MRSSNALRNDESEIAESGAPRSNSVKGYIQQLSNEQLRQQAVALAECFRHYSVSTDYVDDNIGTWRKLGLPIGASDIRPVLRRDVLGSSDEQSLEAMMMVLKEQGVMKYLWGSEHYELVRSEPKTTMALHELGRMQRGSIIFVPVDLSGRHTDSSVVDARRLLGENEFGLGIFEGGCGLLSHRHMLPKAGMRHLYIGDTYEPGPDLASSLMFVTEEEDKDSLGKIYIKRQLLKERTLGRRVRVPTAFTPK